MSKEEPMAYDKTTGYLTEGKAVKFDTGKLRFDLIPPECTKELARVYTIGANKYGDDNWRQGMEWKRIVGALERHLNAWKLGERYDQTDGQEHLASVAWCAFSLLYYQMYNIGKDDRWVAGAELGVNVTSAPTPTETKEEFQTGGTYLSKSGRRV